MHHTIELAGTLHGWSAMHDIAEGKWFVAGEIAERVEVGDDEGFRLWGFIVELTPNEMSRWGQCQSDDILVRGEILMVTADDNDEFRMIIRVEDFDRE